MFSLLFHKTRGRKCSSFSLFQWCQQAYDTAQNHTLQMIVFRTQIAANVSKLWRPFWQGNSSLPCGWKKKLIWRDLITCRPLAMGLLKQRKNKGKDFTSYMSGSLKWRSYQENTVSRLTKPKGKRWFKIGKYYLMIFFTVTKPLPGICLC